MSTYDLNQGIVVDGCLSMQSYMRGFCMDYRAFGVLVQSIGLQLLGPGASE